MYAPTKAITIKYNEHRDLYHKGDDDETLEIIDLVNTSGKLRLYQVDQHVYYFDEEKKMLHGQNISTPIHIDKFLGIFKQEQETYLYLDFGKVYQLKSELNENVSSEGQIKLMIHQLTFLDFVASKHPTKQPYGFFSGAQMQQRPKFKQMANCWHRSAICFRPVSHLPQHKVSH